MKLSTLKALLAGGRLRLFFDVQRLLIPTYRLAFLSAAATEGLLARLRGGPIPAQQLLTELAPNPAVREGLVAWLAVGVRLGELSLDERGYGVRGRLARRLAEAEHDARWRRSLRRPPRSTTTCCATCRPGPARRGR
jgi:hypothetical protein